jgi:hypothetical protein
MPFRLSLLLFLMLDSDFSLPFLLAWCYLVAQLVGFLLAWCYLVAQLVGPLDDAVHLGTRGCLCDFTSSLDDVRLKVLNGFICHYCCTVLASEGFSELPKELSLVLKKDWLGQASEPEKPAGIAANLGYNLFTTKGPQPTAWETFKKTLQEEWVKQLLTLVMAVLGAIAIAVLLVLLGLQK